MAMGEADLLLKIHPFLDDRGQSAKRMAVFCAENRDKIGVRVERETSAV